MIVAAQPAVTVKRQRIQVQGLVQGVGFRPFVFRVATEQGLVGFVRNDNTGLTIEVEGNPAALEAVIEALATQAPPLAKIDSVTTQFITPVGEPHFTIVESQNSGAHHPVISPDVCTCNDCLREVMAAEDRRYRYPFTNCTNCGPRFSIVLDTPYDRDKTTMRAFPMCPDCAAEYHDPLNRRFHAQPNACPTCGPRLQLIGLPETAEDHARALENSETISTTAKQLAQGAVVAIKGIGGFHLACDASNTASVARLRSRKHREDKPFALMVPDLDSAQKLCFVSPAEAELLQSHRRPIVLLARRPDCSVAPEVAPRHNTLGLMLPYTPLHSLLLSDYAEQIGPDRLVALVMTSGNLSSEPIAFRNEDARERLALIADQLLLHNRDIYSYSDDSIARIVAGKTQLLRRSRGYVPEPIKLGQPCSVPILAVGAHLKNTFCLGQGYQAIVSQHIGDLENLETLSAFRDGIAHLQRLFDISPEVVAYDLHPDYLATKYALDLDLPQKIGVQHHHAHIASVIAEHALKGPVIGIAADGSGYGTDRTIWGGEVLVADLQQFERVAHLIPVPLPGAEQAIRQPWRMAAVYLQQAYGDDFLSLDIAFVRKLDRERWHMLAKMIRQDVNSPLTSSLGRLFDAVAALLNIRAVAAYEGQASIELEMAAIQSDSPYPFDIVEGRMLQMDMRPVIRAIVEDIQQGTATAIIAGRFHQTLAELFTVVAQRVRTQTGLQRVVLSGGVFQNRLLLEQSLRRLEASEFETFINHKVPPNDGGLSLGQLAIAAAHIS